MADRKIRPARSERPRALAGSEPHLELVVSRDGATELPLPPSGDPLMVSSATRHEVARVVAARVAALIEAVEAGRIFDAVTTFYASDVALGRGALAPMFGFEIPAARGFLRRHVDAEWCGFEVRGVGVNGDTSFIECTLEFCARSEERLHVDQVAVAQWENGKIVRECLLPSSRGPL
ncbi:MAG: hypothetical protein QF570_22400 [Myxococcota bacterium]|jgi:hypothetical protein|nr:hypothetical protein [Myxococcota bacterium]